jgi:hypothetical protein
MTKEEREVMQKALTFIEDHSEHWNGQDENPHIIEKALRRELVKFEEQLVAMETTAEELLFKEMSYIATISTGQVNRVAKQAIWATRIVKGGVDEISEGNTHEE